MCLRDRIHMALGLMNSRRGGNVFSLVFGPNESPCSGAVCGPAIFGDPGRCLVVATLLRAAFAPT